MDLILQYTQTNIEDQVATLQNDINVLLPATTAAGGLLLHQQMMPRKNRQTPQIAGIVSPGNY